VSASSHPARPGASLEESALPVVAALAAVAASWPILGIYFFGDDFEHLFGFANFGLLDSIALPHSGHMQLVRNAVFYALFRLFGMWPTGFFAVALAVHVANVLLLFVLVRRLTGSSRLACVGAVLLAISPANPGTLGWVSVHGHALAATFTLTALLLLVPREADARPPTVGAAAAAAGCMLAASQCFGTAIAVALTLPGLAVLLRPSILRAPAAAALLCAVPVLTVIAMWLIYPQQSRVNPSPTLAAGLPLWMRFAADIRHVVPMVGHLLVLGAVSLVLGAAYPLTRYPDFVAIGTAAVLAAGVSGALIRGSWKDRRVLVALLAVAIGGYFAVAAGRASIFAALGSPGVLVRFYADSLRYHYLAQVALAVVVCLVLAEAGRHVSWSRRTTRLLFCAWGLWAVVTGVLLRPAIDHKDAVRAAVAGALRSIGDEVERHPVGSTVCVPNAPAPLTLGFPGSVGIFMLYHPEDELEGRRVVFVSSDPSVLRLREVGGRLARLVAPPGRCPAG
jgi:hypothetical protein